MASKRSKKKKSKMKGTSFSAPNAVVELAKENYQGGNTSGKSDQIDVPKFGEFLLYLILAKQDRENILGDLCEDFFKVKVKFGISKAKVFYYTQVFSSAWPLMRRVLGYGLWVSLAGWIKRYI